MRAALLAEAPTAAVDTAGNGAAHLAASAGHTCLLKLLLRKVYAAALLLRPSAWLYDVRPVCRSRAAVAVGLHARCHRLLGSLAASLFFLLRQEKANIRRNRHRGSHQRSTCACARRACTTTRGTPLTKRRCTWPWQTREARQRACCWRPVPTWSCAMRGGASPWTRCRVWLRRNGRHLAGARASADASGQNICRHGSFCCTLMVCVVECSGCCFKFSTFNHPVHSAHPYLVCYFLMVGC